tara:strand:+ start:2239 stop:2469 length:231 start_codon:yes stop_codon:yes gene_type:complete
MTSNEIACAGGITNVNKAIAAEGRPIPRKPLTIPDIKKTKSIKIRMLISLDGNKLFQISLFISKNKPKYLTYKYYL